MATDATIGEPHGISMGIFRFFGDIGSLFGLFYLASSPMASAVHTLLCMSGIIFIAVAFISYSGRRLFREEETRP